MLHNFRQSLQHEREQAEKANDFYTQRLHVNNIKRFSTDSDADMIMQRKDIDLQFDLNDITYLVSEKFRDKDFGDLYIEVFSKYPHTKSWLFTGSPNAILYFTPTHVYWITHKSLQQFCFEKLFPAIPENYYQELYENHKPIVSKCILIDGESFALNIIQSHNKDGAEWETIGVSVDFDMLEKFGVKFLKYKL